MKRSVRAGVEDRWHREPRKDEQPRWPADDDRLAAGVLTPSTAPLAPGCLNPVDLLVRYALVPASTVVEYTEEISGALGVVTRTPTRTETKQARYDPNAPGL